MTTRSHGSSLVGPPTTVAEDESLVDDELPFQDENRLFSADNNDRAAWAKDGAKIIQEEATAILERQQDPALEHVVNSFNDELDSLAKTFDSLLSRQEGAADSSVKDVDARLSSRRMEDSESSDFYRRTPRTVDNILSTRQDSVAEDDLGFATSRRSHQPWSAPTSAQIQDTNVDIDPPPSTHRASPLRNYEESTPAKKRYVSSASSYTPSEPPPAPVQTPAFAMPTPNRQRRPRKSPLDLSFLTSNNSRYSRGPPSTSPMEHNDIHFELSLREKDDNIERLRAIIENQEKNIENLELENNSLRQRLDRHLTPLTASRARGHDYPSSVRREDFDAAYSRYGSVSGAPPEDEEERRPMRSPYTGRPRRSIYDDSLYRVSRTPPSTPGDRRLRPGHSTAISGPPRHIQTLTERVHTVATRDQFSPGTRFVAELATLMKLEPGHHAPLSIVLDKHWDNLKHHFDGDKYY